MLIYPAIDLRGGRVVRLTQGDYDRMTVYGDDPVAVAQGFVQAGATCLHAVDLDGAKDGSPKNRTVIGQLCKLPLSVEVKQCMDADNLHRRLKKIIGQVQTIDRMVDEDVPCEDILAQINTAKSALHGCGKVVLEGHIKH